jgi:hypothetical protein
MIKRYIVSLALIFNGLVFSSDYNSLSSFEYLPFLKDNYRVVRRINYLTDKVYIELWADSIFLGVKDVIPLDKYFELIASQELRTSKTKVTKKAEPVPYGTSGLIPDIELPRIPLLGEGTRINISGSDRISFGGRQTFTKGFTPTAQPARVLPELKMEQQLQVKVDGTIGDRMKVLIDHNSERTFGGRDQIKLTYSGTEDDVIQNLEFGDTRLLIPATSYTGDLPARKGLFGLSGRGKLGPIDLYMVASREEAQGESKEFRGRTRIMYDTIADVEFVRRTFFSLGEPPGARIFNLRVYVKDNTTQGESALATVFPQFPESIPTHYPYDREIGFFSLKIRDQDYLFHEEGNVIEFIRNTPQANYAVAVSYVVEGETVGGIKIVNNIPTLVLKLIKPSREDTLSLCWNYELKNVYRLGGNDIKLEGIKILRIESGVEPVNYKDYETEGPTAGRTFINILGLDPDGDGKLEWPQFDGARGLIVFPFARPFDYESIAIRNPIIYRRIYPSITEDKKYLIVVSYTTTKSSFSLGQVDIEEGSEKVYVNGLLVSKEEYEVNYSTGELKFKNPLPPNADVKVTYEYRPLFSLAQKSLLGTRAEWKLTDYGKVGSSIFYRDEITTEAAQKPRLGSEPLQRLIAEADFSYSYKPQWISDFLKSVPFLNNKSDVTFNLATEGAISLPNLRTQSTVYIDDFEETQISQNVIPRGLLFNFSSVPVLQDTQNFARKRIFWYNPTTLIRKDSIFGSGIGEEGKDLVEYLRIVFSPDNENSWAGIMTCLSQSGWNLKDVENLEVIFRNFRARTGRIHFTIATRIDEDVPRRTKDGRIVGYNGFYDTEDRNGNGILDEALGEDAGLDGILGDDARNIEGDDGNDDYDPYTNPIGTEGNRRLDDEDLDKNGFSRYNDYYEYTISLTDSVYFNNLTGKWKLLRIPLTDSVFISSSERFFRTGLFSWEDVRVLRIWFSGFTDEDTIDIYSISFVGSKWQKARVFIADTSVSGSTPPDRQEKVKVATISQKTDINYTSPFELQKDQLGRLEYEASLSFTYDSIKPGHGGLVVKTNFQKEDYREYKQLKIYLYNSLADPSPPQWFLRIGSDSLNFYEYRSSFLPAKRILGRDGWYEFEINLDSMVYYKTLKTRADTIIGNYRIYGNPSLADIRYQALGIINPYPYIISGSVWFNDMRLVGINVTEGYGFTSNLGINLGDLATLGFSYTYSDPNFKRFSEGRGIKTSGFGHNTAFTMRTNLDRFLPQKWGINFPLSFRKSQNHGFPKFSNLYSDYQLPKERQTSERQIVVDEQWAINNITKRKSNNKILNYTFEALNYSGSWRRNSNLNYLGSDSTYGINHSLDYSVTPDWSITVADKEISPLPSRITVGVDLNRSKTTRYTARYLDSLGTKVRKNSLLRKDSTFNANFNFELEASPIEDLEIRYNQTSNRDLALPKERWEKFIVLNAGQESDHEENFSAQYEFELGDVLKPEIRFEEVFDENRPKRQGEYRLRNFTNTRTLDLSSDFSLSELMSLFLERGSPKSSALVNTLSRILDEINLNYTQEHQEQYQLISDRPSFLYRLGLSKEFSYDTTTTQRPIRNQSQSKEFQSRTGLRIKNFSVDLRYSQEAERQYYTYDINETRSSNWPDFSFSIGRLEELLKKWVLNSDLNFSFRQQRRQSGTLLGDTLRFEGRREEKRLELSPLLGWRISWKNRLNTNFAANYTQSIEITQLAQGKNINHTDQKGANLSLSYSFSAPQGIPLPFLKYLKLTSNVNLNWNLRYTETKVLTRYYLGNEVLTRNDRSLGTDLAASYQISNTVQAGITGGYTEYQDRQRGRSTQTIDLNFWVQFNF